jgi:glutathione reductase (NADPH)
LEPSIQPKGRPALPHLDAFVVGTGVAGRTAAEELAGAGLSVALVDYRGFGGTCALRGCEPKKALYNAAEVIERVRDQDGNGVVAGDARLDWRELMAFKRTFTDTMPDILERSYKELGVLTLHGGAAFISAETMTVDGEEYSADAFFLCTGAMPRPLGIEGQELVVDSEAFMELAELPERVAFIGGGFVSFELAGIASAAGASVTIQHRGAAPLRGFDPQLVEMLVARYRELGIDVRLDAPVDAVRRAEDGSFVVDVQGGAPIAADLVVHGAGRVPDLKWLDLETGGVAYTARGITVDEHLRSVSNPRVFAAGDAAALGAQLTPVGVAQARIAVRNLIEPGSATFEPAVTPSAVFSEPPLASAGIHEEAARRLGLDVAVRFLDTSEWTSSRRIGQRHSGIKTIVDAKTDKLLGAHVLGEGAEDLINIYALAIAHGVTAGELRGQLWAYPTAGSEIVYTV